jgi:ABC-2 type transport system permease protein
VALVLARLRIAIQFGAVRSSGVGGVVTFLGSWLLGIAAGVGGAWLVAMLDAAGGLGEFFVSLLFVVVFVLWILVPVTLPIGGGDVIDPAVLEQYPLTRAQQISGLLIGGLLGPAAFATLLLSLGSVVTPASDVDLLARVVSVLGAVLFTVVCVAASSAVRALVAEVFASRAGRNVAVVVMLVFLIGSYTLSHLLTSVLAAAVQTAAVIVDVASWTPPGAAASLVMLVTTGDWAGAGGRMLVLLATLAVAVLLWGWALRRHVKGRSARPVSAKKAVRTTRSLALVPAFLSGFRSSPMLGAASQQLRYYFFRAPRAVQFIAAGPIVAIVFSAMQVGTTGLPFAAALAAVLMGFSGLVNLFGYDGRGVETTVATGASLSRVLVGKLLAISVYVVPMVAVLTIGLGVFFGRMADVPIALVTAYAALAFAFALGAVTSVWGAYDQEAPKGDRSAIGLRMMGAIAILFGVLYGLGWVTTWASPVVPVWAIATAYLVVALIAAIVAIRVGGRELDRHPERLLEPFTPR